MASTIILYHADCLDGFGAAYAAWKRFADHAEYLPCQHGEVFDWLSLAGRRVYILDFSFPRTILEAMAKIAEHVTLIDHHHSAARDWQVELGNDPAKVATMYQHPDLPLTLHFDLQQAGCVLAWQFFHPLQPAPSGLNLIADRDMWRSALPDSTYFCRALRQHAFDFVAWDRLLMLEELDPDYEDLIADGQAMQQFLLSEVKNLSEGSMVCRVQLRGECIDPLQASRHGLPFMVVDDVCYRVWEGLAVNAPPVFASELGHLLCEKSSTFGLTWHFANDGEVKVSLRANGKVNVADLAKNYGGGGHPNAAGFRLPYTEFFCDVLSL